jgi:hypothetical protein
MTHKQANYLPTLMKNSKKIYEFKINKLLLKKT